MSADLGLQGTEYSLASTMNNVSDHSPAITKGASQTDCPDCPALLDAFFDLPDRPCTRQHPHAGPSFRLGSRPSLHGRLAKVSALYTRALLTAALRLSAPSASSLAYSKRAVFLSVSARLTAAHERNSRRLTSVSVITAHYYRRSEQPVRVSIWYCTVGFGQIASSLLSFGLGKIANPAIESWRILFITVGLITVLTSPIVYWFLPPNIQAAKFFTEDDKAMALERVRANQTGTSATTVFKWSHIVETLWDPKTYLFGGLSLCVNFGATVATAVSGTIRVPGCTNSSSAPRSFAGLVSPRK